MPLATDSEALLFPGQGSQTPGMREVAEESCPELVTLARELVGEDPFDGLDRGTRFIQPAMYCASLGHWIAAGRPLPQLVAGHSLGELAALAAAGAFSEEDGVRLAALRGRLMQDAAEAGIEGAMLAVLGADEFARDAAARHGLTVANDNAPGQLVLSGPKEAIEATQAEASEAGARTMGLPIPGAFHSPAMETALPGFTESLAAIEISPPKATVLCSTTATPFDDIRRRLAEALVRPVRWRQTLVELQRAGARRFVEVGPGKVLRGLVRRTLPDAEATTLDALEAAGA